MTTEYKQTELDHKVALPMFVASMAWLMTFGLAIHLAMDTTGRYFNSSIICGIILLGLWIVFFLEHIAHRRHGGSERNSHIMACMFPPLRLGGRDHVNGKTLWLPGWGWRTASNELAAELERKTSYPMIAIALLVLPLLVVEHLNEESIQSNRTFGFAVQIASALIWVAFAAEFIVSMTIVKNKFAFVRSHWLDLAIILLPIIAFMRVLRLAGAARLSKLSRTAKVFRVKGLAMRAWRAVLILEIVDRLFHGDVEKRIAKLQLQIQEKQQEIMTLQAEVDLLESQLETRTSVNTTCQSAESNPTI